jgi:Skp family chaperone for outer membrane proteins
MPNRQTLFVIAAVAGLVSLGSFATLRGQVGGQPQSTRVAVADVKEVFNNLQEMASIRADIQTQQDALSNELSQRQQELRNLEADLGVLNPNEADYEQTRQQIREKAVELEVWQRVNRATLQQEAALQMANMYRKTLDAVGRVADQNGYDLVLYRDNKEPMQTDSQQSVSTQIFLRKVLWVRPSIDVTDQVTQMMNNEFGAGM